MQQKVLAVVSRTVDYRESDRILTLITRERGVMSATARGSRKPQSKLHSGSQLFCYGEFELRNIKGIDYVSQVDLREVFYNLRLTPETFSTAAYVCALCQRFSNPDEENKKIFSLLLNTLDSLCNNVENVEGILLFFIVKLMDIVGYRPQCDACIQCGDVDGLVFFTIEGGAICESCAAQVQKKEKMQKEEFLLLDYLADVPSAAFDKIEQLLSPYVKTLLPLLLEYSRCRVEGKLPMLMLKEIVS